MIPTPGHERRTTDPLQESSRADLTPRQLEQTTMFDFGEYYTRGLTYTEFLDRYATDEQRRKWDAFYTHVSLTDPQRETLARFTRDMNVLVLSGAWCGDCVNQCPIFEHFTQVNGRIQIRYFDRDDHPELTKELETCGGARVPSVVFLSEDNYVCGRYGDRTLAKYRQVAAEVTGEACSSGLLAPGDPLTVAVVQDWLNEFERIQLMLRTSGRLRKRHGD